MKIGFSANPASKTRGYPHEIPKNRAVQWYNFIIPVDYLPSKNFAIRALLILAVLAGWFLFSRSDNSTAPAIHMAERGSGEESTALPAENSTSNSSEAEAREAYIGLAGLSIHPEDLTSAGESATSSEEKLRTYGNELQKALLPYGNPKRPNELEVMVSATKEKSLPAAEKKLIPLENAALVHGAVRADLLSMKIPGEVASAHAELVTGVVRLEQIVKNMAQILDDPLKALASAQEYSTESMRIKQSVAAIDAVFVEHTISFEKKLNLVLYETN